MSLILGPGIALMYRLNNEQRFPAFTVLFTLPLVVLVSHASALLTPLVVGLALAPWLLAVYLMAAFYVQADRAWQLLLGVIHHIGAGDLTASINIRMAGYFGEVMRALEDVNRNLGQIVGQVRRSTDAVGAGADHMTAGITNLAERTRAQTATLMNTAAGMERLAAAVQRNAANCQAASALSSKASEVARQGAQTMSRVVDRMATIDGSAKRIADIIGVIEGIAFQTNILAINAAVEAARAGAQGLGFSVVASEIRDLAHRSADAAREVRALIEDSVARVTEGTTLVTEAGSTIDGVVDSVQQVTSLIGQVAAASTEQSTDVEEIRRAIARLEHATEQNGVLVQEASTVTRSLDEETRRLIGVVSKFTIDTPRLARVVAPLPVPAGRPPATVS